VAIGVLIGGRTVTIAEERNLTKELE